MLTLERPILHHVKKHESNPKTKATPVAPYENVNFDLERMTAMLDTDFVPVPKFDNSKDLINWIESGEK